MNDPTYLAWLVGLTVADARNVGNGFKLTFTDGTQAFLTPSVVFDEPIAVGRLVVTSHDGKRVIDAKVSR